MKTISTKNKVFVLLVSLNLGFIAYLINDKFKLSFQSAKAAVKRHATVEPVSYFKNSSELEECYKDFLSKQPEVDEGSVTLNLSFTENGAVDSLELIHSDLNDDDFQSCLVHQIKLKKYSVSDDRVGVNIAQKLNFHKRMLSSMNFDVLPHG